MTEKEKSTITVEIDKWVKARANQILERMGIDQTTAINMFYHQIIEEHRLPFQPSVDPTIDEKITNEIVKNDDKKILSKPPHSIDWYLEDYECPEDNGWLSEVPRGREIW